MGGFKLVGENYVVHSTAPIVCYCPGYVGRIDKVTEEALLRKPSQVLDPYTDLPVEIRAHFLAHHLPTDMAYAVRSREIDDVIHEVRTPWIVDASTVDGSPGWGSQFATFTEADP
jgi:hypothetical protein